VVPSLSFFFISEGNTPMRYALIAGVMVASFSTMAFASDPPKPITVTVNPSVSLSGGAKISQTFQAGSVKVADTVQTKTALVVGASLSATAKGFTTP